RVARDRGVGGAGREDQRDGQSRIQPGLAHGARSRKSADGLARHYDVGVGADRESRGALLRRLPEQGSRARQGEPRDPEKPRRADGIESRADSVNAGGAGSSHQGDGMSTATFKVWRGDRESGGFQSYTTEVAPGMVALDAIHQIQAEQANDLAVRWNCKAGKCGSCSAEVNGNPRLMCMTRLNQLDLSKPVTVEPMRAFPPIRDLVTDVSWNFRAR